MNTRYFLLLALLAYVVWKFASGPGLFADEMQRMVPNGKVQTKYAVSKEIYSDWKRTSRYVAVRDGTRLAIDIYRPAIGSSAVSTPLPVVLVATPYHRSDVKDGKWIPNAFFLSTLEPVLKRGYVIAFLDIRGRGASFGTVQGGVSHTERDREDLYDIIEWLAAQPWSDGHIGMAGCSYVGLTQFLAADHKPPHLRAIVPASAEGWYGSACPLCVNGMGHVSWWRTFDQSMYTIDVTSPAPPVDEDPEGTLLKQAVAEHKRGWDEGTAKFAEAFRAPPQRGSSVSQPEEWKFFSNYKKSGIAVFQYTGWRDVIPDEVFAWYRNLAREGVPQKLVIGPWYHCAWYSSSLAELTVDHIRWFDHWLKGIDNGIEDEPPIRYYLVGAPQGTEWRSAAQWPLPGQRRKAFFLGGPMSGSSTVAGILTNHKSEGQNSSSSYRVDYSTSTAKLATRFHAPSGDSSGAEPGLVPISTAALDEKEITYTTEPFGDDAEITGFPTVSLWVTSTVKDQDFFFYLEEVDETGLSTLISDGAIRASASAIYSPPFDNEGLPWHPAFKSEKVELSPDVPIKLELALYPMSNFIQKGHRLRMRIENADKGEWDTPEISPEPTIKIYHDVDHPSLVTLPFIATKATPKRDGKSPDSSRPQSGFY